jgi:hypothetical protein
MTSATTSKPMIAQSARFLKCGFIWEARQEPLGRAYPPKRSGHVPNLGALEGVAKAWKSPGIRALRSQS